MAEPFKNTGPVNDAQLEKEIADALGDQSLEQLMDQQPAPPPDKSAAPAPRAGGERPVRRGTIASTRDNDVLVDLGDGTSGFLPVEQFDKPPTVGESMEFQVIGYLEDEGLFKLSRLGAVEKATWESIEPGQNVEAHVTGMNTGGLELKIAGQRAFMPASHIDLIHVEDLSQYLNQKLACQVIELNRRAKRIVLSRRALLESERQARREQTLAELEVGQIRDGVVSNVKPYGAFVDIGGVDGMVHVSDMAWSRVSEPAEVVAVGQKVRVKVLKIDAEANRIALGLKQVEPDPWEGVEGRFSPGTAVTGKVTRTASFGAFVELAPGLEGLIPIGELSWSRVDKVEDVLQAGQSVRAQVMAVDPGRRRIGLSLKQLGDDPWRDVDQRYPPGAEVEGTVTRTAQFGAFVELEPGVEGLAHISELAAGHVKRTEDVVKAGQTVRARVIDLDPDKRRIGLSLKPESETTGERTQVSSADVKKYIAKPEEARATQSLMSKFADPHGGGLKGGI